MILRTMFTLCCLSFFFVNVRAELHDKDLPGSKQSGDWIYYEVKDDYQSTSKAVLLKGGVIYEKPEANSKVIEKISEATLFKMSGYSEPDWFQVVLNSDKRKFGYVRRNQLMEHPLKHGDYLIEVKKGEELSYNYCHKTYVPNVEFNVYRNGKFIYKEITDIPYSYEDNDYKFDADILLDNIQFLFYVENQQHCEDKLAVSYYYVWDGKKLKLLDKECMNCIDNDYDFAQHIFPTRRDKDSEKNKTYKTYMKETSRDEYSTNYTDLKKEFYLWDGNKLIFQGSNNK